MTTSPQRALPIAAPPGVLAAFLAVLLAVTAGTASGSPVPGQVVVHPDNPSWLQADDGEPCFIAGPGDPEDFLYRGRLRRDGTRDGDQKALIRKLARSGANSIYLQAVRSHGGDGDATHNPFLGHDPRRGLNPAVLDQWDEWLTEMDRHGIVIFFFFYDDDASIWDTDHEVGPEERAFLHALVDRFEHLDHLIWVVAEEYNESFSKRRVSRIAAEIRAADDHDHPIATHKWHGLEFSEFAGDPNLDQFAIQYNVPTPAALHEGVLTARRQSNGLINLVLAEADDWGHGELARRKAWAVAMGGAYVMAYGWDIASTPKRDLADYGRLVEFMESTDFDRMEPRDDLAAGDTLYVLARPGTSYIAYAPEGRGRLGLRELTPGTYRLRWLDIPSGRVVVQDRVPVSGGTAAWPRPRRVGGEAALYVERLGGDSGVVLASRPGGRAAPAAADRGGAGQGSIVPPGAAVHTGPAAPRWQTVFADSFDRRDADDLGNGWVEIEGDSRASLSGGAARFASRDEALRPMILRSFPSQRGGIVRWTFETDFRRAGKERSYGVWMQLGRGKKMRARRPGTAGVAVSLHWGGPDGGLHSHEGLGYVVGREVHHLTAASGPQKITVELDLDRGVYSLAVGDRRVADIPVENRVAVDTVRFFTDGINTSRFEALRIDSVSIARALPPPAASGTGASAATSAPRR